MSRLFILTLLADCLRESSGFVLTSSKTDIFQQSNIATSLFVDPNNQERMNENIHSVPQQRRQVLQTIFSTSAAAAAAAAISAVVMQPPSPASAVAQRAVGGAEVDCRAKGNCLELGQLDGAVGWNWGA